MWMIQKRIAEQGKACTCPQDEVGWSRSENLSTSTVDEAGLDVSKWLRHAKRELAIRSDNVKELAGTCEPSWNS